MAELYYIDLVSLLRAANNGIKGCTVYGKIVRQTKYPPILQPGVGLSDDGQFVIMEVFAVNVGQYTTYLRENGIQNKDNVFMVNGNIIAYANKKAINGVDWYQITGTLRMPSRNQLSTCVAMFDFYKSADNKGWSLNPCAVEDLDISAWDRHSPLYSWINVSADADEIKHPPEVLRLQRFEEYERTTQPVPVKQPVQPPSMQEVMAQNNQVASVSRFVKENRNSVKPLSPKQKPWIESAARSDEARKAFINTVLSSYADSSYDDKYLKYMLKGLKENFKHKPIAYAMTGRSVVKKYLDTNENSRKDYIGSRTVGDFLLDIFDNVSEYILDHNKVVNADGDAYAVCTAMFSDKEAFYAGVVGVVLGIPHETMADIVTFCGQLNVSITKVLNENPYLLQFISTLGYDEIERIAMCFGKHEDRSLSTYRNIAMINAYISDSDNGSTAFELSKLPSANIGVRLTKVKYEKLKSGRPYLADGMVANINSYIRNVNKYPLIYNLYGFRLSQGSNYIKSLSKAEVETAIRDYLSSGLGVVNDGYITSNVLFEKEIFVYHAMQALAEKTYKYKKEDIEKCIAEYEELVGFKLEKSQVEAVHLLVNGAFAVAGSAGSGKTTVSRCIVYTLRKLDPMLDIKFAAPTGKAAKRMQEVVQEECRTLHSTFKIGQGQMENNVFFNDAEDDAEDTNIAYFFDESAMVTIDLLYRVLKKVSVESARVFLFGDFNQLPPIGKGLPFKNLLRFLPCVFLDVVKRAAEGSNITANSSIVNNNSEVNNWRYLNSGKDFFLLPCGGDKIQSVVYDLCAHYLGKKPDDGTLARQIGKAPLPVVDDLTPDDIQVVSPLTKEGYPWGATALNQVLQPLFNPVREYRKTFVYQVAQTSKGSRFVIGDRVIHIDKNMYSMQWYGTYKGHNFQKIYGYGICNGEVGKVVDFFPAYEADFYEESEPMPDGFEYRDNMRIDSSYCEEGQYFVVVEYYDYISARNFYILYRAELNRNVQSNEGTVLKGEDIQKLNLFYAGTTHKLQGSQAKLIIFALDTVRFSGFVTRQMVYTMMTRAEKLCFGVGSVDNNPDSMLSKARRDIASADTLTIGELLM